MLFFEFLEIPDPSCEAAVFAGLADLVDQGVLSMGLRLGHGRSSVHSSLEKGTADASIY
jgi:hypothetical protein